MHPGPSSKASLTLRWLTPEVPAPVVGVGWPLHKPSWDLLHASFCGVSCELNPW